MTKLYEFFEIPKKKCKIKDATKTDYEKVIFEDGKITWGINKSEKEFIKNNGFTYNFFALSPIKDILRNNFEKEVIAHIDNPFIRIALIRTDRGYKVFLKFNLKELDLKGFDKYDIYQIDEKNLLRYENILKIDNKEEYERFKRVLILNELTNE